VTAGDDGDEEPAILAVISFGSTQKLRTGRDKTGLATAYSSVHLVLLSGDMVRRYQDLIAWQTAEMFRDEVHRLVARSSQANGDLRFRSQIQEASRAVPANIVEGFLRFSPREFMRFLDYAVSSLGEAESRLQSGIKTNYFSANDCAGALKLALRCLTATIRLKQSQKRLL